MGGVIIQELTLLSQLRKLDQESKNDRIDNIQVPYHRQANHRGPHCTVARRTLHRLADIHEDTY